jgi:hypothetical protein
VDKRRSEALDGEGLAPHHSDLLWGKRHAFLMNQEEQYLEARLVESDFGEVRVGDGLAAHQVERAKARRQTGDVRETSSAFVVINQETDQLEMGQPGVASVRDKLREKNGQE